MHIDAKEERKELENVAERFRLFQRTLNEREESKTEAGGFKSQPSNANEFRPAALSNADRFDKVVSKLLEYN